MKLLSSLKLGSLMMIGISACISMFSCTSTPTRFTSNETIIVEPTPTPQIITTNIEVPEQVIEDIIETPPFSTAFSRGIYLAEYSPGTINTLQEQNGTFPIQHIILANPNIQSIDDIMFQAPERAKVQQTVHIAQSQNIATYLWSREIHLEGSSFIFSDNAPLVVARQTTYRNLLQSIPELSGIVLSLDDALLPPWKAESRIQNQSVAPEEKVRFIIQMLNEVVTEEFGKQLIVSIPVQEPESTYVLNAVRSIDDRRIQLITTSSDIAAQSPINNTMKVHQLVDLSGSTKPNQFSSLSNSIQNDFAATNSTQHAGLTVKVGTPNSYIWNSANGVNWQAFTSWTPGSEVYEIVWDQWIQNTIGTSAVSDEGRLLRSIIKNGTIHSKPLINKLAGMGIIPERNAPTQTKTTPAETTQFLVTNLDSPTNQMLTDLAQDQFETIEWTVQGLKQSDQFLKPVMRQPVFEDLQNRLQYLYWNTLFQHFSTQSILGYLVWKNSRNEQEALHLENHLQELEKIASSPQAQSIIDSETMNHTIALITAIREDFPRVLVGSTPRTWNKVSGVRIQQTNSNEAVLYWQTDFPSRSRIFLSVDPPRFNRVIDGDNREVLYHQAVLRDINPEQEYSVRIQCITSDGQVTNSGIFPLQLKSLSL